MGGNAALRRAYGCPIAVPGGGSAARSRLGHRRRCCSITPTSARSASPPTKCCARARRMSGATSSGARSRPPATTWRALVFYNAEHRILISGDALWENGFGFVMPPQCDPPALPATRATLDMLAALDIRRVIPGHGEPFDDVAAALERAYRRTEAFERDPLRMARHALKVVLVFALLDRERMPLATMPEYVEPGRHLSRLQRPLLQAGARRARRATDRRARTRGRRLSSGRRAATEVTSASGNMGSERGNWGRVRAVTPGGAIFAPVASCTPGITALTPITAFSVLTALTP